MKVLWKICRGEDVEGFFSFFKSRFWGEEKRPKTRERDVATTVVVQQPWKEKEALEDIFSGRRKRIIVASGSVHKNVSISHTAIILDPFPDFPFLICFPCSWTFSLDKKSIRNFRIWEMFQGVLLFSSHWLQLFMINLWLFVSMDFFFFHLILEVIIKRSCKIWKDCLEWTQCITRMYPQLFG